MTMQLAPSGHVTDRSPAAAAAVAGGGLTRLRRLLSSLSCAERARRRPSQFTGLGRRVMCACR